MVFNTVKTKVKFRPPIKVGTTLQLDIQTDSQSSSSIPINCESQLSQSSRNSTKVIDQEQVNPLLKKNKKRNKVECYKSLENFYLIQTKMKNYNCGENKFY